MAIRPKKYTIIRKIADGGMAEIFLARQHGVQGFQKTVVLKRIRSTLSSDPQFKRMLVDEAHVAMGLNHGNITQILDLGEAGGRYFLVMELVDGWSLAELFKRARAAGYPMPMELKLHIVIQVCRALAYAHAHAVEGQHLGIVHRDVSPQNVLVNEQGEVKLTDFGIAKAQNRSEKTAKGVVKGKVAFMSPEQASAAPVDGRSDLFSTGSMLYAMVTGVRPFKGATELETLMRVQAADFVSPAKLKPRPPVALTRIILKAMAKKPEDRYPTAGAFLADLEEVQRQVFKPAGTTELKAWMDALQRRDGVPPISRTEEGKEVEAEAVELTGSDVVALPSEASLPIEVSMGAMQVPPPVPALLALEIPALSNQAKEQEKVTRRRPLLKVAVLGGLVAGALWFVSKAPYLHLSKAKHFASEPVAPSLVGPLVLGRELTKPTPSPVPSPSQDVGDAGVVLASGEPDASIPVVAANAPDASVPAVASDEADPSIRGAAGAPDASTPSGALATGAPDASVTALPTLAQGEAADEGTAAEAGATPSPDAGSSIVREAPASHRDVLVIHQAPMSLVPVVAAKATRTGPRVATAKGHAESHELRSVLLTSDPEGAKVTIGNHTLGHTPTRQRFRIDMPFELVFALEGYEPQNRRLVVGEKTENPSLLVTLKRASASRP
jgi:serine/threonine-protein kinase